MPLSKYDKYFGGQGGAKKARAAMIKKYGSEVGEQVFYATMNRNKGKKKKSLADKLYGD